MWQRRHILVHLWCHDFFCYAFLCRVMLLGLSFQMSLQLVDTRDKKYFIPSNDVITWAVGRSYLFVPFPRTPWGSLSTSRQWRWENTVNHSKRRWRTAPPVARPASVSIKKWNSELSDRVYLSLWLSSSFDSAFSMTIFWHLFSMSYHNL